MDVCASLWGRKKDPPQSRKSQWEWLLLVYLEKPSQMSPFLFICFRLVTLSAFLLFILFAVIPLWQLEAFVPNTTTTTREREWVTGGRREEGQAGSWHPAALSTDTTTQGGPWADFWQGDKGFTMNSAFSDSWREDTGRTPVSQKEDVSNHEQAATTFFHDYLWAQKELKASAVCRTVCLTSLLQ